MSDADTAALQRRVETLEGQVGALVQLLLSHIVAADVFEDGLAAATRRFAQDQQAAAFDQGKGRVGLTLGDLLDAIDAAREDRGTR